MRVLVVEDDEMIAEGLRFSLMSEDYEILSAWGRFRRRRKSGGLE